MEWVLIYVDTVKTTSQIFLSQKAPQCAERTIFASHLHIFCPFFFLYSLLLADTFKIKQQLHCDGLTFCCTVASENRGSKKGINVEEVRLKTTFLGKRRFAFNL